MTTAAWWCAHAWLGPGRVEAGVLVEASGGVVTRVTPGAAEPSRAATRLGGLTLPGLANVHSHAFHRALRARTQAGRGTFWTWRDAMYDVAAALTPASYLELATAVYAEMALAGVTCVGEFHYVRPNAMGLALVEAAGRAGLRITLLDACYLRGGVGRPLAEAQRRFSDGSAAAWAARVDALAAPVADAPWARLGAAAHSVRAVGEDDLRAVADWAHQHDAPLHVHVSEQRAENDDCLAEHGLTPTALLDRAGVLGPTTTAIHATHLTATDIATLGLTGTGVCLCPTTERDLGDGIGPAAELAAAGVALSVGSDSHAQIDLLGEARAVEWDQRLRAEARGGIDADRLLWAATAAGHLALGWDAGAIAVGRPADLVTIDLATPRTAGGRPDAATAIFAATPADITSVVAGGREIVRGGRHTSLGDVGALLAAAIG